MNHSLYTTQKAGKRQWGVNQRLVIGSAEPIFQGDQSQIRRRLKDKNGRGRASGGNCGQSKAIIPHPLSDSLVHKTATSRIL